MLHKYQIPEHIQKRRMDRNLHQAGRWKSLFRDCCSHSGNLKAIKVALGNLNLNGGISNGLNYIHNNFVMRWRRPIVVLVLMFSSPSDVSFSRTLFIRCSGFFYFFSFGSFVFGTVHITDSVCGNDAKVVAVMIDEQTSVSTYVVSLLIYGWHFLMPQPRDKGICWQRFSEQFLLEKYILNKYYGAS